MMERYLLRYFLAVIDAGNFSKAAEQCNVSQPTLSAGIAKLEKGLGQPLFLRSNRRVELTQSGARLAPLARRIEEEFTQAEREVSLSQPVTTLRLGVLATTPPRWAEQFIRAMAIAAPDERVELVEGRERDLLERLARGRLDMALTILRDNQTRFEAQPILTEGYALALSRRHRLADRASIAPEELIGETMLVRRQCEALPETSRFFTARGIRPFFAARTSDESRAIAYVRSGLGITVMPECFTDPGIARPWLEEFTLTRRIGLLFADHASARRLREPARLLADALSSESLD